MFLLHNPHKIPDLFHVPEEGSFPKGGKNPKPDIDSGRQLPNTGVFGHKERPAEVIPTQDPTTENDRKRVTEA